MEIAEPPIKEKSKSPSQSVVSKDALLSGKTVTWLLTAILLLAALFSISTGAYKLSFDQMLEVFAQTDQEASPIRYLLLDIRLPRVLLAVVVGAGLSISGVAIQGLFRNPLADPTLIGITSGGMLFAIGGIVFSGSVLAGVSSFLGYTTIALFSFIGSLLTTLLIFRMATFGGRTHVTTMLLAGIAVTALAGAITGLMTYFSTEDQLRDITFWTLGSLSSANWKVLLIVSPAVALTFLMLMRITPALDLFMLGESEASYLGVNVQRTKWIVIIFSALAVGICVSVTGIISFVALIVPHILRLLTGARHRFLMINSALLGAILLLIADTAARTLIAPAELPIGVLTALLGAPFFIWMLMQARGNSKLGI